MLIILVVGCKKEEVLFERSAPIDTIKNSVAEMLMDGNTVQAILDEGYTPKDIYDNDNSYLDSIFGKLYQEGLIFHFNTDGSGLVVAPTDDCTYSKWGCEGKDLMGATNYRIGGGRKNTADIIAGCGDIPIAAIRTDALSEGGYSDWYLPNITELVEIKAKIATQGLGSFGVDPYWSSNQVNAKEAQAYEFSSGLTSDNVKSNRYLVRAVRQF